MKKTFILTGTILSSLFVTTSAFASTYEVQDGDTLYNISQKHNTNVQELKTLNKLSTNLIVPGQVLKVDNKKETYVVKTGDSLSEIAKKFNTSVDGLVKLNPDISNPNLIVVGQTIRVNGQAPVQNSDVYKVQLGDSLFKISKAHNTTVDFLLALNPEITNENNIRVGQSVKVTGTVVDVSKPATPTTQTESKVQETTKEVVDPAPVQEKTQVSKPTPVKEKPQTTKPAPAPKTETKPATAPAASNSVSANNVLASGDKYLGAKYVYGASTSSTDAFDCSSFTYRAFKEGAGITLPRTSAAQSSVGQTVSINSLQKGDLIFFDTDSNGSINHVGIYAGNGQMLNASTSKGVSYASIHSSYWEPRIVKAVRVLN